MVFSCYSRFRALLRLVGIEFGHHREQRKLVVSFGVLFGLASQFSLFLLLFRWQINLLVVAPHQSSGFVPKDAWENRVLLWEFPSSVYWFRRCVSWCFKLSTLIAGEIKMPTFQENTTCQHLPEDSQILGKFLFCRFLIQNQFLLCYFTIWHPSELPL